VTCVQAQQRVRDSVRFALQECPREWNQGVVVRLPGYSAEACRVAVPRQYARTGNARAELRVDTGGCGEAAEAGEHSSRPRGWLNDSTQCGVHPVCRLAPSDSPGDTIVCSCAFRQCLADLGDRGQRVPGRCVSEDHMVLAHSDSRPQPGYARSHGAALAKAAHVTAPWSYQAAPCRSAAGTRCWQAVLSVTQLPNAARGKGCQTLLSNSQHRRPAWCSPRAGRSSCSLPCSAPKRDFDFQLRACAPTSHFPICTLSYSPAAPPTHTPPCIDLLSTPRTAPRLRCAAHVSPFKFKVPLPRTDACVRPRTGCSP
jgi:hypothetical protein